MNIRISYDGRVGVTNSAVYLGEDSIASIISSAFKSDNGEYREINAEVTICINSKPDKPLVLIEEDEEC